MSLTSWIKSEAKICSHFVTFTYVVSLSVWVIKSAKSPAQYGPHPLIIANYEKRLCHSRHRNILLVCKEWSGMRFFTRFYSLNKIFREQVCGMEMFKKMTPKQVFQKGSFFLENRCIWSQIVILDNHVEPQKTNPLFRVSLVALGYNTSIRVVRSPEVY